MNETLLNHIIVLLEISHWFAEINFTHNIFNVSVTSQYQICQFTQGNVYDDDDEIDVIYLRVHVCQYFILDIEIEMCAPLYSSDIQNCPNDLKMTYNII